MQWRESWLFQDTIAELPVLGSFCKDQDSRSARREAGKCVAMIVGGTIGMALDMRETDPYAITRMALLMTGWMFTFKVLFNLGYRASSMLYQYNNARYEPLLNLENTSEEHTQSIQIELTPR